MNSPDLERPSITDGEFRKFQTLFMERIGLQLSEHKKLLLTGRLGRRLVKLGLATFQAYHDLLASGSDPSEMRTAIDLITTHETFFFREPAHLELLARDILQQRPPHRELRVWSAACSSGEEAWSIAMVLHDRLGAVGWKIVATDVSGDALRKTTTGLYSMERISGIPQKFLKAYCLKGTGEYEGKLLIHRILREHVVAREANLLDLPGDLSEFDVIFLRNVMIYFDAPTKEKVLQAVCKRLRPEGWLIVGQAESIAHEGLSLRQIRPSVFRRLA